MPRNTFQRNKNVSERLHGCAFTGGFSAGHFNTAGPKSGWKPSNVDGMEAEDDGDE